MVISYSGHSHLCSIGTYIPRQTVRPADLLAALKSDARFDIPHTWIEDKLGIYEVAECAYANPSDIAIAAAERALAETEVCPGSIGVIAYCGIDRDFVEPATAHVVQTALGASNAMCVDISNACNGTMSGIQYVDALIGLGVVEYGLVVSGELGSGVRKRFFKTLETCDDHDTFVNTVGVLTAADSGGAVLLGRDGRARLLRMFFKSAGHVDLCYYRYDNEGQIAGQMLMEKICGVSLRMQVKTYRQALAELKWEPRDIDYLICHQVGKKYHQMLSKYLHIPLTKMRETYSHMGNLITTSVPLGLSLIWDRAAIKDRAYIVASGAGISLSQVAIEF